MRAVKKSKGFSLVELSVVITIIGITLGGALTIATKKTEADKLSETEEKMDAIEQGLINFLATEQRIPCPSDNAAASSSANGGLMGTADASGCQQVSSDGNFSGGNSYNGGVPTKSLNLPDDYMVDGWGRRFTYAVDFRFANNNTTSSGACSASLCFTNTSTGSLSVKDASDANLTAEGIYVLISHGKNGNGAWKSSGSATRLPDSADTDELENAEDDTDFDNIFYQRTTDDDFDDVIRYKTKTQMIVDMGDEGGITDTTTCTAAQTPATTCSGTTTTTCTDLAARVVLWCLQ